MDEENLSLENTAFLKELPESLSIAVPPRPTPLGVGTPKGVRGINGKFVLTHGAINSPDIYTLSVIDAAINFSLMKKITPF